LLKGFGWRTLLKKGGDAIMTALDIITLIYAVKYIIFILRCKVTEVKHNKKDRP